MAFKMKKFSGFGNSPMKKDDDKDKKELESLLSPESQDTMAVKTTPGFADFLIRKGMTHGDVVKIIKNVDKNKKKEQSGK